MAVFDWSNGVRIFGWQIQKQTDDVPVTPISPVSDDGAIQIEAPSTGIYVDLDASYRSELDLIHKYRQMALQPEMENAINDLVDEAICHDTDSGEIVKINLDKLDQPDNVKDLIREEFHNVIKLLDFNNFGDEIFRKWYIDGRLYYNVVIDPDHPENGIQTLVYIDSRKIKKVRQVTKDRNETGQEVVTGVEEFYVYNDKLMMTNPNSGNPLFQTSVAAGVKMSKDSVVQVTSGIYDPIKSTILSHLHKAIRPLNQLRFMEDATVVYRVTRAPERRVFYIDVSGMAKPKAEQYLKDMMTKYRNKLTYDSSTGAMIDDRKHFAMLEDFWMPRQCLALDTKIQLLDGRIETLSTIISEYKSGKELWAMSTSPEGKFVPAKIKWAGITRTNAQVVKVTLDSGESITCTPDHRFILRDGTEIEAQHLEPKMSVMPAYTRHHRLSGQYSKKYHQMWEPIIRGWRFTHRIVNDAINEETSKEEIIHHRDFNRFNNNPTNLIKMNKLDHITLHQIAGKNARSHNDEEYRQKLSMAGKAFFLTEAGEKRRKEISIFNKSDIRIKEAQSRGHLSLSKKYKGCTSYYNPSTGEQKRIPIGGIAPEGFVIGRLPFKTKWFTNPLTHKNARFVPGSEPNEYVRGRYMSRANDGRWISSFNNHKIASVEWLSTRIDTGDIEVDCEYHNFALGVGIFVHNSNRQSSEITTLPAGQNLNQMDDVLYFQKQLYRALGIPASRIEQPQGIFGIGRPGEITRDEVKFDKFIHRMRSKFSVLFDELMSRQLVLKKVCTLEEWQEFKQDCFYVYHEDNNFAELKDTEILSIRLQTLNTVQPFMGIFFSKQWVWKNILRLGDDEIDDMNEQMAEEMKEAEAVGHPPLAGFPAVNPPGAPVEIGDDQLQSQGAASGEERPEANGPQPQDINNLVSKSIAKPRASKG